MRTCNNCGAPLDLDAAFCMQCGARVEVAEVYDPRVDEMLMVASDALFDRLDFVTAENILRQIPDSSSDTLYHIISAMGGLHQEAYFLALKHFEKLLLAYDNEDMDKKRMWELSISATKKIMAACAAKDDRAIIDGWNDLIYYSGEVPDFMYLAIFNDLQLQGRMPFSKYCGALDTLRSSIDRAQMYGRHNRFFEARDLLLGAIQKFGQEPKLFEELGACYMKMDRNDDAIACCRQAVAIDGTLDRAYSIMALCYKKKGDMYDALGMINEAIHIAPNDALRHFIRGDILSSMRDSSGRLDLNGALAAYQTGLAIEPNDPEGLRGVVAIAHMIGNKMLYKNTLERLRAVDPDSAKEIEGLVFDEKLHKGLDVASDVAVGGLVLSTLFNCFGSDN